MVRSRGLAAIRRHRLCRADSRHDQPARVHGHCHTLGAMARQRGGTTIERLSERNRGSF
jgi:hypothetical protein